MGDLGHRDQTGKIDNSGYNPYGNGKWAVTFAPADFALGANYFEVYHIAIKGPAGSSMQMFSDRTFYDATSNGELNSWDPQHVLRMNGGQTLYMYYDSGAVPAPQVTIWLQQITY